MNYRFSKNLTLAGLIALSAWGAVSARAEHIAEHISDGSSAASKKELVATCRTPYVADAGYFANIYQEPGKNRNTYKTYLNIQEDNFGGFIDLGTSRVEVIRRGLETVLIGADIELAIFEERESPRSPNSSEEKKTRSAYLTGEKITQEEFATLKCTFYSDLKVEQFGDTGVRPFPPSTCMAYWTGAFFNTETRSCIAMGTSGCSSPFEFRTLKECDSAYTLK